MLLRTHTKWIKSKYRINNSIILRDLKTIAKILLKRLINRSLSVLHEFRLLTYVSNEFKNQNNIFLTG